MPSPDPRWFESEFVPAPRESPRATRHRVVKARHREPSALPISSEPTKRSREDGMGLRKAARTCLRRRA